MLIEYIIHLPLADNDGNDLTDLNEQTVQYFAEKFGGASVQPVAGVWYDANGTRYAEPCDRVIVAAEPCKANDHIFQGKAQVYSLEAKQLAMYLVISSGVQILDTIWSTMADAA